MKTNLKTLPLLLIASLTMANCKALDDAISTVVNNAIKSLTLNTTSSVNIPNNIAVSTPDSIKSVPSTNAINTGSTVAAQRAKQNPTQYQPRQVDLEEEDIYGEQSIKESAYNVVTTTIKQPLSFTAPADNRATFEKNRNKSTGLDRLTDIADRIDNINKLASIELLFLDNIIENLKSTITNNKLTVEAGVYRFTVDEATKTKILATLIAKNLNVKASEIPSKYRSPAFCYMTNDTTAYPFKVAFSYDKTVKVADLCAATKSSLKIAVVLWNTDKSKFVVMHTRQHKERNSLLDIEFNVVNTVVLTTNNTEKTSTLLATEKYTSVEPALGIFDGLLNKTLLANVQDCTTANSETCVSVSGTVTSRKITFDTILSLYSNIAQYPALLTPTATKAQWLVAFDAVAPVQTNDIQGKADKKGGFLQNKIKPKSGTAFILEQAFFNASAEPTDLRMKTATNEADLTSATFTPVVFSDIPEPITGGINPDFTAASPAIPTGNIYTEGFTTDTNGLVMPSTNTEKVNSILTNITDTGVLLPGFGFTPAQLPDDIINSLK